MLSSFFRTWSVPWILFSLALALTLSSIDPGKLPELWRKPSDIGTLAVAMTAIMLTGGIDLSVGSIVALGVVLSLLYRDLHWPIAWAAGPGWRSRGDRIGIDQWNPCCFRHSSVGGHSGHDGPFRGLAMAMVDGQRIASLPASFTDWAWESWGGLPTQIYLLAIVSLSFS